MDGWTNTLTIKNMGESIVCKLTGKQGPSVKAHIIPRSFYEFDRDKHISAENLTIEGNDLRISNSPIGEYDRTILTVEGEDHFSEWDNYASQFFIKDVQEATLYEANGESVCLEIEDFDYTKLKLFYLSLLWRAEVSKRQLFRNVKIGPHETRLRQHILDRNPGSQSDFSVFLMMYRDAPPSGFPFYEPHRYKDSSQGFNGYAFSLGRHQAHIKVDSRRIQYPLDSFAMSEDLPLRIPLLGNFRESARYQRTLRALRRYKETGKG